MTDLSRRRVIGTAAWSAPAIVAATAVPAYAVSLGSPAVVITGLGGDRRPGPDDDRIDVTVNLTNTGTVAVAALSFEIGWDPVGIGNTRNDVADLTAGWTFTSTSINRGGILTFADTIDAGESIVLEFSFGSDVGRGTMDAAAPVTTPAGSNAGNNGIWGDLDPVDLDVGSFFPPAAAGACVVGIANRGTAASAPTTLDVTFTPDAGGTFAFGGTVTSTGWIPSPMTVATTSSPVTIQFTSAVPIPPYQGSSVRFTVTTTGTGTMSAIVSSPDTGNNDGTSDVYPRITR